MNRSPGVLVLEDRSRPEGQEFPGFLFGAPVSTKSIRAASQGEGSRDRGYGEVVFNTSMTGYQEILTDPSYYGQIVCMTVPHIGNTGTNEEDRESAQPWCAGFVIHELSDRPSSWRSRSDLEAYLIKHGIPGILGVDTRALTRHLRTQGVVRGLILPLEERSHAESLLKSLPSFEGRDLIGEVTTRHAYRWPNSGLDHREASSPTVRPGLPGDQPNQKPLRVVAMDFGIKWNLLRSLHQLGCEVEVVSAQISAEEILAKNPDGIFLSNGPGDPAAAPYAARTVRSLVGKRPIFGVCMGHQILALAMGARTYKLKFGHRGGNQPVLDCESKKVEISSHNHGYAVDGSSLPKGVEVTHVNLNDRTIEGLQVEGANAFSVQYHPEACPGPHDSMVLFRKFVEMMRK